MKVAASILLSTTLLVAGSAFAQGPQTSEDIVKFFEEAELGATRGICVGTEEQCRREAADAAPTSLDMLVNFELNSATLTPDARAKLDEFVKALKDERLKAQRFVVEGHTDATGPDAYNDRLSEQRAQSVSAFLLENGIEPTRIDAIGLGKNNPRTEDPFDPVNRRVEMRLNIAQ